MKIEPETALSFDDVLLVPQKFNGTSRGGVDISTNLDGIKLEIPLIAANMPSICQSKMAIALANKGGLGIIHRMQSVNEQVKQVELTKTGLTKPTFPVGAAIGVGDDWEVRAKALCDVGVDIICIDVAHGHQDKVRNIIRSFRKIWPRKPLIVGNIATNEAMFDLTCLHAKVVKVGVGGGSLCTTRIKTGCGIPTFQSIVNVRHGHWISDPYAIIADGGIKNSGDIVKSLAAGANACMIGSLFAGTDEAPGKIIKGVDGNKYKIYRGAASYGAKKEFFGKTEYIEGEETLVPYRGSVNNVIDKLCEGIRSGLSYSGASNILELQEKAVFNKITMAGIRESKAHGLL